MPIGPEDPNRTFAKNWSTGGAIALDEVDPARRKILAEADTDKDGLVTMREARDRLIVRSKVLSDPASKTFKKELEAFLLEKTGLAVDTLAQRSQPLSHVFYIQVNNAANKTLREETDLRAIVQKDPDKPALDKLNLTAAFNTDGDVEAASDAFRAAVTSYFDDLLRKGQRLTGFIISGHSNGTSMLQETEHHMYYANLDPREVLREIKDSDPKYAKLMDGCEKMAALACFQGGALNEWAELFPNASLAGTRQFAPLSSSGASAALFDQAATAHQVIEDAKGDAAAAAAAAQKVPFAADLRSGDPALLVPVDPAQALAKAKAQFATAETAYKAFAKDIGDVRTNGGAGVQQRYLDQYYAVANTYYLALNDLWVVQGRPGGDRGAQAQAIDKALFERDDLFAIRKHLPRPQAAA
ncbi:MAG: hypothetical protein IT381_24460 [Deltaproteobacteria bacterium]|nr:hypothetical protein [Deltaproteobacteria bacterium]